MLKRKLSEIGSIIYRKIVFPFVRMGIERRTKSVMEQGTYMLKGATLCGKNFVGRDTIINNSVLGFGSYISRYSVLTDARVGKYCSIGHNLISVGGGHPARECIATHPAFYSVNNGAGFTYVKKDTEFKNFTENKYIDENNRYCYEIGNDVWIGANVSICQGVHIGDGAVVGAGALVNTDIEPYAIYAGVPAKKIGMRFSDEQIEKLLKIKWWDRDEAWIEEHAKEFADVDGFISKYDNE